MGGREGDKKEGRVEKGKWSEKGERKNIKRERER